MRWPCISPPRVKSPELERPQARAGSSSSSDIPQDDQTTNPPQFHDPGLARLFSDAASFDRILTSRPSLIEEEPTAGGSGATQEALNGFSQLIARDLNESELAVSEKLAQLAVSNWAAGSTSLAPDVDLDESEDSASDDEQVRARGPRGTTQAQAAGEPDFEDKLTPDEILDLLQQEFGALAPLGEEKLLLETDAGLFQDVVILVCLSCEICLNLGVYHS